MNDKPTFELMRALYRVTERMDDNEPIKWHLRKKALDFDCLASLGEEATFTEVKKKERALFEIIRLLELASSLAFASRINFDALSREYRALRDKSENTREEMPNDTKEKENKSEITEIHIVSENRQTEQADSSVSDRQRRILSHLSSMQSTSVSELSPIFNFQVSEKTIQRDLNDLMIQGLVRAEGDKRWRKYSMISS